MEKDKPSGGPTLAAAAEAAPPRTRRFSLPGGRSRSSTREYVVQRRARITLTIERGAGLAGANRDKMFETGGGACGARRRRGCPLLPPLTRPSTAADPYCTVRYNGNTVGKTSVQFDTVDPVWDGADRTGTFWIDLPGEPAAGDAAAEKARVEAAVGAAHLLVEVWDKDMIGADDFLGQTALSGEALTSPRSSQILTRVLEPKVDREPKYVKRGRCAAAAAAAVRRTTSAVAVPHYTTLFIPTQRTHLPLPQGTTASSKGGSS